MMWDWRQLKWMSFLGWWPSIAKTNTNYRLLRIYGILLLIFDFIQLGPEIINLYNNVAEGSLKGTVLNLNTTVMGVLCSYKTTVFLLNEKRILYMVKKLAEMEKNVEEAIGSEEYNKIASVRFKICHYLSLLYYGANIGCLFWIFRPIHDYTYGIKTLIVETWVPWSIDSLESFCLVFVIQWIHVATGFYSYIVIDTIYYCFFEVALGHIDALKLALSKLDFSRPAHNSGRLKFCINYHKDILEICRNANELMKNLLLFTTMSNVVVLCLCVFELSSLRDSTFKTINVGLLTGCQATLLMIYCWYCHNLSDQLSINLLRAAYDNNWYVGSVPEMKALNIMCCNIMKPVTFGFIVDINLDTQIMVYKSVFSYFNFLQAISEE